MRLTRVKCSFLVSKWETRATLPPRVSRDKLHLLVLWKALKQRSLCIKENMGTKQIENNSVCI